MKVAPDPHAHTVDARFRKATVLQAQGLRRFVPDLMPRGCCVVKILIHVAASAWIPNRAEGRWAKLLE